MYVYGYSAISKTQKFGDLFLFLLFNIYGGGKLYDIHEIIHLCYIKVLVVCPTFTRANLFKEAFKLYERGSDLLAAL